MAFTFNSQTMESSWGNESANSEFGDMEGRKWGDFIDGLTGVLQEHMAITMQNYRQVEKKHLQVDVIGVRESCCLQSDIDVKA